MLTLIIKVERFNISVKFEKCPPFFELVSGKCNCAKVIEQYAVNSTISVVISQLQGMALHGLGMTIRKDIMLFIHTVHLTTAMKALFTLHPMILASSVHAGS